MFAQQIESNVKTNFENSGQIFCYKVLNESILEQYETDMYDGKIHSINTPWDIRDTPYLIEEKVRENLKQVTLSQE